MARKLKLTTGQEAIVDNEDYGWASKHSWRLHSDGHVVRDGKHDEPKIVYLCNEVLSRAQGIPLHRFNPPLSSIRH
jgi:hypothetical protein